MWKRMILPALGLSSFLAAWAFSSGILVPVSPAAQAFRAETLLPPAPAAQSGEDSIWATGKIEAWRQATVGAKSGGRLEAFLKKEGDFVSAGEPVARLERGELQAELREAQAKREQALRERDRAAALREQKVVSEHDWEEARTAYLVADAQMAALEARLEDAAARAPFAGRLLKTFGEAGESVTPGQALFVLGELSSLKVRAEIDELDLGRVALGAKVRVWPDALAGRSFEGRLERLSGMLGSKAQFSEHPRERVDAKVLEAEIRLPASKSLLPGMNAKVEILR